MRLQERKRGVRVGLVRQADRCRAPVGCQALIQWARIGPPRGRHIRVLHSTSTCRLEYTALPLKGHNFVLSPYNFFGDQKPLELLVIW